MLRFQILPKNLEPFVQCRKRKNSLFAKKQAKILRFLQKYSKILSVYGNQIKINLVRV